MLPSRVIPVLLLKGDGLVKTERFKAPVYIGDPLNTVRLFNDKEVDELVCLDIMASREGRGPDLERLRDLASECFMPFAFGGGISSLEQARRIFDIGVEKVILNTHAIRNPKLVQDIAGVFGSQAVVVSIDVRRSFLGSYEVMIKGGTERAKLTPEAVAVQMTEAGAGEILLTSIDREGTGKGYDTELIRRVATVVELPVVACGGAGRLQDFRTAIEVGGADAVAASSLFVFHGKHRAVLISYPSQAELAELFR